MNPDLTLPAPLASSAVSQPAGQSATRPWHLFALAGVLLLAVFLHFFNLQQEGYGNLYYAAAVKSMLQNWHNFFYVAFDPGGYVAVDKPPLGLWIQALSAMVFGFNGWALMLPQALAGVFAVALLYHLVRRVFGPTAGVLAALILALTPISIAANRNNTMDSQLVLTSLLAAWAVSKAAGNGKLRWLLLCVVLVGVGFNIKQLQAVMVLPAFYLVYLAAANTAWWKRLWHLALATVVLAVVSLSWAVMVDLTPADQRPFVGSSTNNTVMELIVGHNGAERLGQIGALFGIQSRGGRGQPPLNNGGAPGGPGQQPVGNPNQPPSVNGNQPPGDGGPRGGPGNETGTAGLLRLFNQQLGGQTSWFLPLALLCLAVLAWRTKLRWPLAREHQAVLLWGAWVGPQVIFFSFAGLFHRYYLEMLAPGIAALVGAGLAGMWDDYQAGHWRGWWLPIAVLLTAGVEAVIIAAFPAWATWLVPLVVGLSVVAALALIGLRLVRNHPLPMTNYAWLLGVAALLIAPAIWSFTPVWASDSGLPFAGPELIQGSARPRQNVSVNSPLARYLTEHRSGEKYLAATLNANTAAPIILATGEPVMALGGFSGGDHILSMSQLEAKVKAGEVRYFLVSAQTDAGPQGPGQPPAGGNPPPNGNQPPGANQPPGGGPPGGQNSELTQWVSKTCASVPASEWQGGGQPLDGRPGGAVSLFDCGQ